MENIDQGFVYLGMIQECQSKHIKMKMQIKKFLHEFIKLNKGKQR